MAGDDNFEDDNEDLGKFDRVDHSGGLRLCRPQLLMLNSRGWQLLQKYYYCSGTV
jgi:hypothetical protein